ncbi:PP2C family protein-serine/threonine phosphatase [Streptomyces sp. NBC_01794]|uniref:PP2C family protein-serine/threonine phosphatase n=1 Tax=Streptomyces sp. NBC_01794 TaxID=2975942 RepID=UPI003087FD40|nr:serine/threonine-protein phosphatase [Streptomyces sp. NBC_01794]
MRTWVNSRPKRIWPARYTLRAAAAQHLSPAAVFQHLNSALLDQRKGERFLTAVYATFRATPGGIAGRLCTRRPLPGPDPPRQQVGARGSLLGVLTDIALTDVRFRLAPGDTILLYTDGATEARARRTAVPSNRPQFGEDALAAAFAGCHDLDASGIITRLGEILAEHRGAWAGDDTALLALRVPPRP